MNAFETTAAAPDDPRLGIGGNNPPPPLVRELQERNAHLFAQFVELSDAALRVPNKIEDDETHRDVIELSKKMRVALAQAESTRKIEVEPFKQKVDEVNGVFKSRIDELKKVRERIDKLHEDYSLAKAAAEKRRLEEEAEKRRLEAERLQREAEEAERKRIEAQRAREEEERKAREAEEARLKAIKEKEEAERRAEKERQEAARLAEERRQAEAAEKERRRAAAEQKAKDEADAVARKEQEAKDRAAYEARMAENRRLEEEAKARRKAEEDAAAEARAKAEAERKKLREAEEAAAASKREEKSLGRDSRDALDAAVRQDKQANRIEEKVKGPEADLARSRSEHGAVGTLTRRWECRLVDRSKIDTAAILKLFPFINEDAISAAGFKWMMAQAQENRSLPGFVMEEITVGTVR